MSLLFALNDPYSLPLAFVLHVLIATLALDYLHVCVPRGHIMFHFWFTFQIKSNLVVLVFAAATVGGGFDINICDVLGHNL